MDVDASGIRTRFGLKIGDLRKHRSFRRRTRCGWIKKAGFRAAKPYRIVVVQLDASIDSLLVHEGPVAAAKILQDKLAAFRVNNRMASGCRGMVDRDGTVGKTTDQVAIPL